MKKGFIRLWVVCLLVALSFGGYSAIQINDTSYETLYLYVVLQESEVCESYEYLDGNKRKGSDCKIDPAPLAFPTSLPNYQWHCVDLLVPDESPTAVGRKMVEIFGVTDWAFQLPLTSEEFREKMISFVEDGTPPFGEYYKCKKLASEAWEQEIFQDRMEEFVLKGLLPALAAMLLLAAAYWILIGFTGTEK